MDKNDQEDILVALVTPEECETYAQNAEACGYLDLATAARRRATELRAERYVTTAELCAPTSPVEQECIQAVYAYEAALAKKNGRLTRAGRIWQMIIRRGVLEAVKRAVNREDVAMGFQVLTEMGLQDLTFEAVVLRHPSRFDPETVAVARSRMGS